MVSKRQRCLELLCFSDSSYDAEVIPVWGSTDVSIVMSKMDPYMGRKVYGQILGTFRYPKTAKKLCAELNDEIRKKRELKKS